MSDEPLFDLIAFARRVRVAMAERDLSFRQAGEQMGVSYATLHRLAKARGLPDVETYLRVLRWLG